MKIISTQTPVSLLLGVGRILRGRMEKEMPLPFAQCEVLRIVADSKMPSMSDIATHFKIAAPSATALVEALVHDRYLKRITDENDRRQIRVSLTQKGKTYAMKIQEKREKIIKDMLSTLKPEDIKDLTRILTSIITNTHI